MKKEVVLIIALFLMVFMIGGVRVSAEIDHVWYSRSADVKCVVDDFSFFDIYVYLKVDKEKYTSLEINTWKSVNIGTDNLEMHVRFENPNFSIGEESISLIAGQFVFNESQIKGFLQGTARRFGENIEIDGIMTGGSFGEGEILHNSQFKLNIMPHFEFTQCGFSTIGTELKNTDKGDNDYEPRLSALESWKQTIDDWKDMVSLSISDVLLSITGLTTRVEALESSEGGDGGSGNETGAGTWENFKKYITSSTRKKMVCDYAEENRLTGITELGYNCTITYRTSYSGRVSSSCRCKSL